MKAWFNRDPATFTQNLSVLNKRLKSKPETTVIFYEGMFPREFGGGLLIEKKNFSLSLSFEKTLNLL